jgi:hypothetical protein
VTYVGSAILLVGVRVCDGTANPTTSDTGG